MRHIVLILFMGLFAIKAFGAEVAGDTLRDVGAPVKDTLYEGVREPVLFRFVPSRLMFYSPYRGNERSIEAVYALLERYRADIESGRAVVRVMGVGFAVSAWKLLWLGPFAAAAWSELCVCGGVAAQDYLCPGFWVGFVDPLANIDFVSVRS